MKQTAVEWLVEQILSEVDKYNDDCTKVVGVEYWNAFRSCTDLSEYVDKAKEIEKQRLEQFYNHGQWAIIEHGHGETFEDYYNKIFAK